MNPAVALRQKDQLRDSRTVRFILSESEKYAQDKRLVKNIFNYYESIGISQTLAKDQEVRKLYNLAYGVIDPNDYIETDQAYEMAMGQAEKLEVSGLDFYAIIPVLVRGIVNSNDKAYVEYTAQAVNPEVTNDILDKMNNDLRSALIANVEALFQIQNANEQPDVMQQKHDLLMQSKQVQKYYASEYKSEVEQWASHTMQFEDPYFNMKGLERQVLEQITVTGDPTVHVDFRDGSYRPEVLNERATFCMRSPNSQDYSDSQMFGWFEHCTFADLLNKEAARLTQDQVDLISSWSNRTYGTDFTINNYAPQFYKGQGLEESRQNWEVVESITSHYRDYNYLKSTGFSPDLLRVTTLYFYVPRKIGMLTVRTADQEMVEIVDELHEITIPGVYGPGKKSADTLIYGEHVDWFYKPELWRGKKVAMQSAPRSLPGDTNTQARKDKEIWIELDRFEIEHSDPYNRYGLYIPVHGGPMSNQYNDTVSPVKLAAPWQVMYNWVMNRNKQLLATEIGKFYAVPEALIPKESLGGEWETDSLAKFAMIARDTGIGATANPMTNNGGPSSGLVGSLGQVIDMTKTQEIAEKFNIASLFEMACYRSAGFTPEFLFGDISPSQSAKSVAMGQQRTVTQIQHLFTRQNDIMVKVRTTMLSTAKYIAETKPTIEMVYNTSNQGRAIFKVGTSDFPLAKLGVFAKSNGNDLAVIESIKNYVANNNTMGADSYEMATLFSFKSLPELFIKLRDIQVDKQAERDREHAQAMELEQQRAASEKALQEAQMAEAARQKDLDRDSRIMERQIAALGYANDTADNIQAAILSLQTANAAQQEMYDRNNRELTVQAARERTDMAKQQAQNRKTILDEQVALKQLSQKDEELRLYEKDIIARNKRTKAID